ncbi:NADPH:quinone oxidoreductase family protein [Streptomyces fradiae]|uniref:NADPH:quinone oxidoreductase family protein n=1 Tax=Streptomyces fradiae TaxID=1906 RepID=UPI0020195F1E|nr:NADPH:quinone oxidoreductase family protein [Streptomyces fradiae]UQS30040.1 NADPH:quinone oxidoreductase family protein [Streptomyces fradiae]
MQAWRVHRNGEPSEVMRLEETDRPAPGPGQLLLRVRAANVNFPDALLCRGHYQVRPPLPFTPGVEVCADTEDGRRVIATAALPHGGLAEYALADETDVLPAPGTLDDAEAAALHIGYQTGWFGLHRRAALRAGETLLVHAAAGGVGSAAVQLGKAAGARVIGVVGGPGKAATARALGCDTVVDRHTDDIVTAVKDATGGRGADVVYDPVGGPAYAASAKCVAFEGRIVVVGFAAGDVPAPALNHALVKNYAILGLHWGLYRQKDPAAVRRCHDILTEYAAKGLIKPLVSERVALADAASAVQRVADGTTTGRLAVLPTGSGTPTEARATGADADAGAAAAGAAGTGGATGEGAAR